MAIFLRPIRDINNGLQLNQAFAAAIGFASVKTVYSYLGYYNVCHLGGDIIDPKKNIPSSMFISIAGIAVLYLLMNMSVASVLPLEQIQKSRFVVSEYVRRLLAQRRTHRYDIDTMGCICFYVFCHIGL